MLRGQEITISMVGWVEGTKSKGIKEQGAHQCAPTVINLQKWDIPHTLLPAQLEDSLLLQFYCDTRL